VLIKLVLSLRGMANTPKQSELEARVGADTPLAHETAGQTEARREQEITALRENILSMNAMVQQMYSCMFGDCSVTPPMCFSSSVAVANQQMTGRPQRAQIRRERTGFSPLQTLNR